MDYSFGKPIIIKGHCSQHYKDSLFLYTYKSSADFVDFDWDKMIVVSAKPDTNGYFRMTYDLKSLQYFTFKGGAGYLFNEALLLPGDSLFIEIGDTDEHFSGSAGNSINFNRESWDKKFFLYLHQYGYSMDSFSRLVDSLENGELKLLNKFKKEKNISAEFINAEKSHVSYKWNTEKLVYLWMHSAYLHKAGDVRVEPSYFNFIKSVDLHNEHALNDYAYYRFLDEYTQELYIEKWEHLAPDVKKAKSKSYNTLKISGQAHIIDSLYSGIFHEVTLGELIWHKIIHLEGSDVKERATTIFLIDSLLENIKPLDDKNPETIYARLKAREINEISLDNKQAQGFSLPDTTNNMVSFFQFEGKVVLLDIWEVGCVPCMQAIPNSNKLQEEMAGKDFAVIGLCFNSTEENWKSTLRKHKWNGTHLLASKDAKNLINKYVIEGYPRYVLIDKKGIIRNANASGDIVSLKKQIEILLKE